MLHDFTAQQDVPATPQPLAVCQVAIHYLPQDSTPPSNIIIVNIKQRIPRLRTKYHCRAYAAI
jgi:hypothetical protein